MTVDCVDNTVSFIENHYNEPISIKDLETVSYYSYRNIQRIFKCTCGETIGAFQKRLRVENAYKLILYSKMPLSEIALEVGFDNLASFSKAFKQHFGISPKDARKSKPILFENNKISPTLATEEIPYQTIYLPPLKVYFKSIKTYYLNDEIEVLWDKIMSLDLPEKGVDYYGVIADEPLITDEIKCRYDACISQPPKDKTLSSKTILGGRYAQFFHYGSYDTIEDTYSKIYARWILNTKLEFSPSPIIEQYIKHDSNTSHESEYVTAILLPLKK